MNNNEKENQEILDLCVISFKNLQKICIYKKFNFCNCELNKDSICDINLCPYLECLCNFILKK